MEASRDEEAGAITTASNAPLVNITINLRGIPWWGYFDGVVATTMIERLNSAMEITLLRLELRRVRLVSGLARTLVLSDAALRVFFRLGIQLTLTQEIARFCALPILFILYRLRTIDDLCARSKTVKQAARRYWLMGEGRRTIFPESCHA